MGTSIPCDFGLGGTVKTNTQEADQSRALNVGLGSGSPHVLTLTPFYPRANDDANGCFVAESLAALQDIGVRNTVIGVQPFYRGKIGSNPRSTVPAAWRRFFSLPGGAGLPSAGRFLYSSLLAEVRDLHRQQPVHLIHAHAALPCGHAAALLSRKLGIPFVVTVHGLDVFFTNQVSGFMGQRCKRVSSRVYDSAAKTICISEKVRHCILKEASARTVVVYNGVDERLFSPVPDTIGRRSILCVGNLIPIKGQELLLRALRDVQQEFPDVTCDLIGDGPERSRLEQLAEELKIANFVRFLGRKNRAEVAAAMARCTLFALPSRYEGLGCVYLEAMAAGKAVIACTGQGIDEIVEHGRNGWLIEPGNFPALAAALAHLLGNDEMRLLVGAEARRTVLERYTLAHQADLLRRIYCESMA